MRRHLKTMHLPAMNAKTTTTKEAVILDMTAKSYVTTATDYSTATVP